jgi:DNA adenine methylase
MSNPVLVPPLKCQGIKTKLVPTLKQAVEDCAFARWVEPFCGSCVVALNLQPPVALLCDANPHIVRLYTDVQSHRITAGLAKEFLVENGESLRRTGEAYYYEVRQRFNEAPTSLDFLFLNRSCFNGLIRFNRNGRFNTPYGHKPGRFAQAYVTKIVNQIARVEKVLSAVNWTFEVADFRQTLSGLNPDDLVYADPPYAGRHVDYYNQWSIDDEKELALRLNRLPCNFILSTWHSNEFRTNDAMQEAWGQGDFHIALKEHFYHVGSSEDLRHPMIEAFVSNFAWVQSEGSGARPEQDVLFT